MVELRKDTLPADADEILDLLRAEVVPLPLWLELAKAYLDRGNQAAFEQVLKAAVSEETQSGFKVEGMDIQKERLQCLCALGAYYTQLGRAGTDARSGSTPYLQASSLFNAALRIGREVLPSLGQGQLALARVRAGQYCTMHAGCGGVLRLACTLCRGSCRMQRSTSPPQRSAPAAAGPALQAPWPWQPCTAERSSIGKPSSCEAPAHGKWPG